MVIFGLFSNKCNFGSKYGHFDSRLAHFNSKNLKIGSIQPKFVKVKWYCINIIRKKSSIFQDNLISVKKVALIINFTTIWLLFGAFM